MDLMSKALVTRYPALGPIYAVQSDVHNCDEPDRDLDHRLVLALLPGLAPAAPHCVGDDPIFFHDPLYKRPVPQMTASVDDVLRIMHIMRIDVQERLLLVNEAARYITLAGTSQRDRFNEALARSLSVCLVEHRIRQHHADPEAYAEINFG